MLFSYKNSRSLIRIRRDEECRISGSYGLPTWDVVPGIEKQHLSFSGKASGVFSFYFHGDVVSGALRSAGRGVGGALSTA